jgi:outer membrane protein TolC
MKKKIILILTFVYCHHMVAQTYTLEQLKDSALCHNIQIRNARHDVEAARQQRKEAFTKFFPNISAYGVGFNTDRGMAKTSMTPSEIIPPDFSQMLPEEILPMLGNPVELSLMKKNGIIAGVTAIQPIFAGGQIAQGNQLAKVGEEVSRLLLHQSENEVKKTVEKLYWNVVTLTEKIKTIEAVATMLNAIHEDVVVAVDAGVVLHNDLLQVRLRQNETESTKLDLNNHLSLTRQVLAQYCGLQDTAFVLNHPTEETPTPVMQQDHAQAVSQTVEYRLLEKQVEIAGIQKKITIGQNLPTVAIGAGYNYHNLLGNDHRLGMIFATVSVPVSHWWGGTHAIRRKKIEYQKAIDQKADHSELLAIGMQKAWNNVNNSYRQWEIAQRSIEQARENLRLNHDHYKAGISKISDLLEAQLLFQQACDKRADAYAHYQNMLLEYRQSVGQ